MYNSQNNSHGYSNSQTNGNHGVRNDPSNRSAYQQNIEQQLASQDSKKTSYRRTLDHGNNMGRWYISKSLGLSKRQQRIGKVRPESSYLIDFLPSLAYSSFMNLNRRNNGNNMAVMDIETKFVHLSSNKVKHTINTVKWTPEGRRLIVASHSGEFTLWNGMTFNFETIMQAHESPILALQYSHNDEWLLSGDQSGTIKYWQPNFNNVNNLTGHSSGIRDIAFSPNDSKFLTCADDSTIKIWNFNNGKEERTLTGHHWEVKSADWHPDLGLIVSGSKDNLVKLWDPRASTCITTLHGFKHTVNKTRFQPAGTARLLASVSRDRSCRVFDLRTMKDMLVLRDHETDLSCVAWNPVQASLLTTAAYNGSMNHYLLDSYIPDSNPSIPKRNTSTFTTAPTMDSVHKIPFAHEKAIHALEYHPMGHILCSAGTDKTARFWCRARPNDPMQYKDPIYTDDKQGAWYYAVNNSVNAVMEDPSTASATSGSTAATSALDSLAHEDKRERSATPIVTIPGLHIPGLSSNYSNESPGNGSTPKNGTIPGLRGHY
ncbi:polyadenylation factor I subunit 2 [Spathaspora passalidarum NRRL Y-27907]|uniref:Polyadenylation factor subunit 2 n=1 Tax=Spathaspora passalidarum (strain NRRL Y-27907 / 11-Y1) TaxID=619300 RepID=G3AGC2_SPAPN|nr:polyadenylation factor I subunit 2 [Spathaspora passalidarum NRRL Y-27907]EGW35261.1 polyadenylation factor I subunit 2 [Spathaspora passalidarum NRRL Y-27907]